MRILHVLDHSIPLHSGYTFRTAAILREQRALGWETFHLTSPKQGQTAAEVEDVDGLRFYRCPVPEAGPAGINELRLMRATEARLEQLARELKPDVLHAHSPVLNAIPAIRVGKRLGIPVVYEIRAFWEDAAVGNGTGREGSVKYRLTRSLESHVVAGADAVVTICEGLRQDLVARGTDAARITVMPNGVDLALFGTPPAPDPALAAELGLGEGPVIGFIGSFYDYEGIDDLIAAMPALIARQPGAKLLLVGGGPCEAALKAQAGASPAAAAIRFVGRVPHEAVERYYALTDIMAYPRKKSRLTDLVTPLKPLEAMAQHKLVAASDVGGHRELIVASTGVLFAPDDPVACAEALAALLENRADWDAMRKAGLEHVRTSHDWSRNIYRYRDVYQRLLARPMDCRLPAAA